MSTEIEFGGFTLRYHVEDGSWWAECPEMPSLFAGGNSYAEARSLASQAIRDTHPGASLLHLASRNELSA